MNATDNVMTTATTLLAERRKYEGWLAALDSRRESTPAHVFTRVRADYVARLEAVVAELATRADALDARVSELTERADTLESDARAVHDERCEAELRAHVGELEPDAWTAAARKADERLAQLAEEQKEVHAELVSIRELLDAARSPTPAGSAPAVAAGAPVDGTAASVDDGALAGAAGVDASETAPADTASDEPELTDFAPAAVETGEGGMPAEAPDADEPAPALGAGGDAPLVSESPEPEPKRNTGGFDELAFLRNVTGVTPGKPLGLVEHESATVQRPSGERPVDDSLGLILPDDSPAYTPPRRPSTETPMAANVTGNSPIILKGDGKQTKTLKCTDCGSMNYPTEWYCERCGAELSAL